MFKELKRGEFIRDKWGLGQKTLALVLEGKLDILFPHAHARLFIILNPSF